MESDVVFHPVTGKAQQLEPQYLPICQYLRRAKEVSESSRSKVNSELLDRTLVAAGDSKGHTPRIGK